MPYEITRLKKSRRARRNTQIPDVNRAENKCWERSNEGAFNFATADRVNQLLRHVDAEWFHQGDEDGHHCKYGLKADKIIDAIEALKMWLRPRAGKNETGG